MTELRKKIEKLIGMPYSGNVEVKHLVDIFANEVGLEEIKKRVKKPLKGLKTCGLLRLLSGQTAGNHQFR